MLKNSAIFVLLAALIFPSTATAQVALDDTNSQRVAIDDFAIRMPTEWSHEPDPQTVLTLRAPVPSPWIFFRDNIRIKKYPLKNVPDVDVIRALQEREVESKYRVVGSGILGDTRLRMAWLTTSEKEAPDGGEVAAKTDYMIISGSDLFVLHAICETRHLETRRPLFDAIARSIELPSPQLAPLPQLALPAPSRNPRDAARSQDFEEGRIIGRYTFRVMVAVTVVWGIMRLFRRGKSLVSS